MITLRFISTAVATSNEANQGLSLRVAGRIEKKSQGILNFEWVYQVRKFESQLREQSVYWEC
jgi:hypothetical protein